MRKTGAKIFSITLALCAAGAGLAAGEAGLAAAPGLNAPMGARSSGLGQAFTAVPGDGESLVYNPGGLAFSEGFSVSASYLRGFGDSGHSLISAPLKLGSFVLTPGFQYFDGGDIYLNLSDGTTGKVTAEDDRTVYISGACRLNKHFGAGATLKNTRIILAETASAAAVNYDLGVLYVTDGGLSLGASYMNGGGGFKFEESSDPAPSVKRLGAAYRVEINPPNLLDPSTDLTFSDAMFTADWIAPYKDKACYQAGAEMNMGMSTGFTLTLRAGYLFNRAAEGITLGFGVRKDKWIFDYSLSTAKALNARQQATLGYRFK
ncbi:MAG: hypothetical protein AUJ51_00470 [Elusimicrobia bacterium CG1_02_56_21]|nr:MAG: hypothetical protein AUJ51_00470 [Elusimicrobia bacterium CG1_02_56_21]